MLNIIDWLINIAEAVYLFLFGTIERFFDAVSAAVIFISPLYIGTIWGGFLPDLEKQHELTSLPQWRLHPTPIYFLLAWIIALGWQYFSRQYSIEISARRKVVFREIRYICEGLAINENAEADIRCTVWLFPQNEIKTDKDTGEYLTPRRIVQWADYYPQRSPYKKDGRTYRRINPKAGRIFRLYRGKQNQLFIGILGETVSQGMKRGNILPSRIICLKIANYGNISLPNSIFADGTQKRLLQTENLFFASLSLKKKLKSLWE